MFALSDRYSMGFCSMAGDPAAEPPITTAGADSWREWWATLSYDQKATWASQKTGKTLVWPADSTEILNTGRLYYEGAGGRPVVTASVPLSLGEQMAMKAEQNRKMILGIGIAALVGWFVFRKKRK